MTNRPSPDTGRGYVEMDCMKKGRGKEKNWLRKLVEKELSRPKNVTIIEGGFE